MDEYTITLTAEELNMVMAGLRILEEAGEEMTNDPSLTVAEHQDNANYTDSVTKLYEKLELVI